MLFLSLDCTSSVTVKLIGIRLLNRMMNVKKDMPRFWAFLPRKTSFFHAEENVFLAIRKQRKKDLLQFIPVSVEQNHSWYCYTPLHCVHVYPDVGTCYWNTTVYTVSHGVRNFASVYCLYFARNLLHPNIIMHILHTVPHTFL